MPATTPSSPSFSLIFPGDPANKIPGIILASLVCVQREKERESVCGWTDGKLLLDLRVDIMQMVLVVKRKTTRTKLIQMRKLRIPVPLPPSYEKTTNSNRRY